MRELFAFPEEKGLILKQDIISQSEDTGFSFFENLLGYHFADKRLFAIALTHSTYAYEHKFESAYDNERLEFLGDGILDFVAADALFHQKRSCDEGYLSKTRALIVCEATLAAKARDLGLGDYLRLGKGEESTGGRDKPSNLANAMEAIFAAVYLDGGFERAKELILRILADSIETALSGELVFDYKSKILELAQSKGNVHSIRFEIIEESGPVHDRRYTSAVLLDDQVFGQGTGHSKKLAEQEAAKTAYREWMIKYS